jgi:hypothetical protein
MADMKPLITPFQGEIYELKLDWGNFVKCSRHRQMISPVRVHGTGPTNSAADSVVAGPGQRPWTRWNRRIAVFTSLKPQSTQSCVSFSVIFTEKCVSFSVIFKLCIAARSGDSPATMLRVRRPGQPRSRLPEPTGLCLVFSVTVPVFKLVQNGQPRRNLLPVLPVAFPWHWQVALPSPGRQQRKLAL